MQRLGKPHDRNLDHVVPDVPVRQWVLSFRWRLHVLFARRPSALGRYRSIITRAIVNKIDLVKPAAPNSYIFQQATPPSAHPEIIGYHYLLLQPVLWCTIRWISAGLQIVAMSWLCTVTPTCTGYETGASQVIFNPGECAGHMAGFNTVGVLVLRDLSAERLHF